MKSTNKEWVVGAHSSHLKPRLLLWCTISHKSFGIKPTNNLTKLISRAVGPLVDQKAAHDA